MTTRPRHLELVASDEDEPAPARSEVAAAAAARRFYDRVLGPAGTDPEQTGDPLLVPHLRRPDGTLGDRALLERELAAVLAASIGASTGDELDGAAVTRLGTHLAEVLTGLRMIETDP